MTLFAFQRDQLLTISFGLIVNVNALAARGLALLARQPDGSGLSPVSYLKTSCASVNQKNWICASEFSTVWLSVCLAPFVLKPSRHHHKNIQPLVVPFSNHSFLVRQPFLHLAALILWWTLVGFSTHVSSHPPTCFMYGQSCWRDRRLPPMTLRPKCLWWILLGFITKVIFSGSKTTSNHPPISNFVMTPILVHHVFCSNWNPRLSLMAVLNPKLPTQKFSEADFEGGWR